MTLKPSCHAKLKRRHLVEFAGTTLVDAIGRVVCEAECLPRKEFFEAWEVAKRVRKRVHGRPIVDLAAGHGLLAWMLLVLDPDSPGARCVDVRRTDSSRRLEPPFVERWPRLAGRVTWEERDLGTASVGQDELVVSVHACGPLTDRVLDLAIGARAPVAVLPCCQSFAKCDAGGLDQWMEGRLAIDVMRAVRLRHAGYDVKLQHVPERITPQNRLIIGLPASPAPDAAAGPA